MQTKNYKDVKIWIMSVTIVRTDKVFWSLWLTVFLDKIKLLINLLPQTKWGKTHFWNTSLKLLYFGKT